MSLVRFTLGAEDQLVPYADKVRERYQAWLLQQQQAGAEFTERQRWWLDRIADVIATSAGITETTSTTPPSPNTAASTEPSATSDPTPGSTSTSSTRNSPHERAPRRVARSNRWVNWPTSYAA